MNETKSHPTARLGTGRIEALCDGVFAIIMTLLVFDIKLPQVPPDELLTSILMLWPSFIGYAISFVLLGIYWVGHRAQFQFILYADQNLHWLNMLFFAMCGLTPFSTGLLSQYHDQWLAVALYGLNLSLIGIALYLHWLYATRHTSIVGDDISPVVVRYGSQRCLLAPIGYTIAVLLGLISPIISLVVFGVVPLVYIVPSITRAWLKFAQR